jgi:Tfp pilus assembly protein PilV
MKHESNETGFLYMDVMIAVTILLIGVIAMLTAITSGIVMTTTSQQQLAAKHYVQSTIEAIFSARDLDRLGFDVVGNVGDATIPGGVFLTGFRNFYLTAGTDGIVGTNDDAEGPDLTVGTADDSSPVDGFQREIRISNVADPNNPGGPITVRQIDVTVTYAVGNARFSESMTTFAANYRTGTPGAP